MNDVPQLTEFHERIAEAQGLNLYGKYSEREAAEVLSLSIVSLRRLRNSGEIEFVRVSPRKICFFGFQLIQCLLNAVESAPCPEIQLRQSFSKSGSSGLSKRPKSEAWYRTWFDSEARQTRRISLGTSDFDEAKQALTDWFVLYHTKTEETPEESTLAELFAQILRAIWVQTSQS